MVGNKLENLYDHGRLSSLQHIHLCSWAAVSHGIDGGSGASGELPSVTGIRRFRNNPNRHRLGDELHSLLLF